MTADPSIHTIDTGFQRPDFDAAYLIVENGRAAFVDCGTGLSRCRAMQARWRVAVAWAWKRWTGCCSPTCILTTPEAPAC